MTEKIQMTEEQAREIAIKISSWNCADICPHDNKDCSIYKDEECKYQFFKCNGYIRKSELQQKVEEAEEMYQTWLRLAHDDTLDINFQLIIKFQNVVQLLKQSHPEFKENT